MRVGFVLLLAAAGLAFGPATSEAGVLDFEGLTGTSCCEVIQSVAPGYGGFTWSSEFRLISKTDLPGSGYEAGTMGTHSAFNGFGNPVSVVAASAFNFTGAYLTAAWNTGLNIRVQGFLNGSELYASTVVVDPFAANWFNFGFSGINELRFTSSGGTDAGLGGGGTHFVMENFTTADPVPEPATLVLLGSGLAALGLRRRRKV